LTVNQTGADCTVSLNSAGASIAAGGATGSVNVTTPGGCAYNTVLGPTWINVTSGASGTGPGTLTYTVDPNSSTVSRSGTLTIGGNPFAITQQPVACSFSLDTSELGSPFASLGGNGKIGITANGSNCAWTASTGASWATVSPPGGTGNGTVSVSTNAANAAPTAVVGTVTIASQSVVIGNVGISQGGITCAYSLNSPSGTIPGSGGSGSVEVIAPSGCSWTPSSDSAWLTFTPASTSGTADIQFSAAAPNNTAGPLTGHIAVAPGVVFTVTQAVAPCTFNLPASSLGSLAVPGVVAGGASSSFNFTLNTGSCTTLTPVSYVQWISITPPGPTTITAGAGTVNFTVRQNFGAAARAGNIQVGNQVFTVYQAGTGANCNFSLNSYGAAFGQAGGSASFLASESAVGCAIPTPTTSQSSIVPAPPTAQPAVNNIFTQPYTVNVFTSANNAVRVATITFGGQIFTVKQTSW